MPCQGGAARYRNSRLCQNRGLISQRNRQCEMFHKIHGVEIGFILLVDEQVVEILVKSTGIKRAEMSVAGFAHPAGKIMNPPGELAH
ncbi:hypothetical protein TH47_14435 [Thalassospira sp. MCCC 1A02803]|nr:hypothetical protein TH47_14435 [Thalassospira sp. MCCC 1A02803]